MNRFLSHILAGPLSVALAAVINSHFDGAPLQATDDSRPPDGPTFAMLKQEDPAFPLGDAVEYNGGLVIDDIPQIDIIFYGEDWATNNKIPPVMRFIVGLQSTGYLDHLSAYTDFRGARATTQVRVNPKAILVPNYPLGKNLTEGAALSISNIIKRALDKGITTHNPNKFYMVFIDKTVQNCFGASCFPKGVCGAHHMEEYRGMPLGYAWAGDGDGKFCDIPSHNSKKGVSQLKAPNIPGVDGLAHAYAHELVEYITDPMLPCPNCKSKYAYFDTSTMLETADKCAYVHGPLQQTLDGFDYNVRIDNDVYLIQQDWDIRTQNCRKDFYISINGKRVQ